MIFQINRRHKIDLTLGAALLLFIVVAVFSFLSIRALRTSQLGSQATEETLRRMASIPLQLKDAESAQRGFLLTRDEELLVGYYSAPGIVTAEMQSMATDLAGDTTQLQRLAELDRMTRQKLSYMERGIEAARSGDFAAGVGLVSAGRGQAVMDSIADLVAEMESHEFGLLEQRQARVRSVASRSLLLVSLGGGLAILIVAGSRQSLVSELRAREAAERTLSEHNEAVRELYRIASSPGLDVDQKIEALIGIGARRLHMSIGILAETEEGRYRIEAVFDPSARIRRGDIYPLEDTYCRAVIASNQPVLIADTTKGEWAERPCFPQINIESYLGMPVTLRGETVGTLSFSDSRARESGFTDGELDLVQLVAQWIGHELERVDAAAALQQREERYRVLVESANDVIFTTDAMGRFTYVNPAGARAVGFSPAELRGMVCFDLIHPERREEFRERFRSQVESGISAGYYEVPVVTKEGQKIWLGQNTQPLRTDGKVIGLQCVARDITAQLEVEQMKDSFLSVVSHELRTPLTAIRGSLGLLASGKMGTLEERGQRMLEIAAQNTDRLVRLINDLLDIEKIESGTAPPVARLTSLGEVIRQAVDETRPLAESAGVSIETVPIELELIADGDRLMQVMTNLLSNAIKFSSPGKKVTVSVEERPTEVLVAVSDEGRGIPADKREAIFDRFQQVDSSDAREKGGTGLGLPIARSIVQQHGGRLWVESELGRGSTFTFSLPRAMEIDPDRSVLVCEDDPTVATYVREILTRSEFEVIHVFTGSEVVSAATAMRPSVVLLDLSLPGISGMEVLEQLRANEVTRETPVVVMTAMSRQESGIGPDEVSGWIPKPIDRTLLVQAIESGLQGNARFNVMLVESDDDLSRVTVEMLRSRGLTSRRARNGAEAIEISRRHTYDLLLIDPGLPGIDGFALIDWLRRHNRHRTVPVLVYSAMDLDEISRERLRLGPTEFMTKSRVSTEQLDQRIGALFGQLAGVGTTSR